MRSLIMFFVSLILGLIIGILSGALVGLGLVAWITSEIKKDENEKRIHKYHEEQAKRDAMSDETSTSPQEPSAASAT